MLAEGADAQARERDAELHRGDEPRRVRDEPEDSPRATVPFLRKLFDARPARRHEPVLGRDEERVQENQRRDGEDLEEEAHAPIPGALGLGGISSSNYVAV